MHHYTFALAFPIFKRPTSALPSSLSVSLKLFVLLLLYCVFSPGTRPRCTTTSTRSGYRWIRKLFVRPVKMRQIVTSRIELVRERFMCIESTRTEAHLIAIFAACCCERSIVGRIIFSSFLMQPGVRGRDFLIFFPLNVSFTRFPRL